MRVHVAKILLETNFKIEKVAYKKVEGVKVLQIKYVEGEVELKYLEGLGISHQRQVILECFKTTVIGFFINILRSSIKDFMDMILIT